MAPETAKQKKVNEQTDVYNFGATMYRLLTGQLPPPMLTPEGGLPVDSATFIRLLKPVKELAPKTPTVLADLVHRCLAYDPAKRFERASEIQGTLDHLADALVHFRDDRLDAVEW
jgi:serine/threonine protein kinase